MTYQSYINNKLKEIKEQNKIEKKKQLAKQWGEICGYMSEYNSLKATAKHYGLRVIK